ncbi:RraA family protein [Methanobrevibacter sp. DSM 116169]|uniref:RraA family protein n=1 Tax=Methanobrevibacter sp. DSM 116169 TaxID=3242727 RepID=UPI0038FCF264
MNDKFSPNPLINKKHKETFIKNLSIDNIKLNNVTIDDLNLKSDESNFKEYYTLKFLLDNVSSCQFSDAYLKIAKKSPAIYNLDSINNQKTYGKIFTCKTNHDDWGTSAIAIDKIDAGNILFILVDSDESAIWGEIASLAAIEKGVKACAIYGSCRDVDVLYDLEFPIFALNNVSNAGSPLGLGEFNDFINVDGRKIANNDFFFGDENGVVVIEKTLFKDVIFETLNIKLKESEYISMVNQGISLSQITNLK